MTTCFPDTIIDPAELDALAEKNHEAYARAKPFPHVYFDHFLPEDVLEQVLAEFPSPDAISWQSFQNKSEKKLATHREQQMGKATRNLLYHLNSSTFVTFLEKLTGIPGLIPDPHFVGGGLHQIKPGGYLKIHADFNTHTHLKLDRRLNLLLYLNKDWKEEYGGHLELWDTEMKGCEQAILPVFNRCAIFSTTSNSYHGHPNPLTCPEDRTRKSLALYYYSNGRPAHEASELAEHSTLFRERPHEDLKEAVPVAASSKYWAKRLLPPIVYDFLKQFRSQA